MMDSTSDAYDMFLPPRLMASVIRMERRPPVLIQIAFVHLYILSTDFAIALNTRDGGDAPGKQIFNAVLR